MYINMHMLQKHIRKFDRKAHTNNNILKKEWFADKTSMKAFDYAVLMAKEMQDKLVRLKSGSIIMFDNEVLLSPTFRAIFCGNKSITITHTQ